MLSDENTLKLAVALIGAAAGVLFKALFDMWADSLKAKRERAARREQRLDAFRLRRTEFQRTTLLELQDAYAKYARLAARSHHHDVMSFRAGGKWSKAFLPADLDEEYRVAGVSLSRLASRVHDERIRQIINEMMESSTNLVMAQSQDEAENHLKILFDLANVTGGLIGYAIRQLDHEEESAILSSAE